MLFILLLIEKHFELYHIPLPLLALLFWNILQQNVEIDWEILEKREFADKVAEGNGDICYPVAGLFSIAKFPELI